MFPLPLPLMYEICLYLSEPDREHLRGVSHAFQQLLTEEMIWKHRLVAQGLNYLTFTMKVAEIKQVLEQGWEDWKRFQDTIRYLELRTITLIESQEGEALFPDASGDCELRYVQSFDFCPNDVFEQRVIFVPRSIHPSTDESLSIRNYPARTILVCHIQYCDPDVNCDICNQKRIRLHIQRREYIDATCTAKNISSLEELKTHMVALEQEQVPIRKMPLKYEEMSE